MNRTLVGTAGLAVACAACYGQPFTVSYNASANPCASPAQHRLVVTDTSNGRVVIDTFKWDADSNSGCSGDDQPLKDSNSDYTYGSPCAGGWLEPEIVSVDTKEFGELGVCGFDITYRYTNPSNGTRKSMGIISIPGVRVVHSGAQRRHFETNGREISASDQMLLTYPNPLFSPVIALRGNVLNSENATAEYVVGMSLLYPVDEYKHSVSALSKHNGTGQFLLGFHLNPCKTENAGGNGTISELYTQDGDIQPGQTRDYVVAVRIFRSSLLTDETNAWLRVLEPYRKYFQERYGSSTFLRDATPIRGLLMSKPDFVTTANPRGLERTGNSPNLDHDTTCQRPDRDAWASAAAVLDHQSDPYDGLGWPRKVLWGMSGQYGAGIDQSGMNYPHSFGTHLDEAVSSTSATCGTGDLSYETDNLLTHATEYGGLGVWWGRSTQYQPGWGAVPAEVENLDTTSRAHRMDAFGEVDVAARFGTSLVGLDQFVLRGWDGVAWVRELRAVYPSISFATEPSQSDILAREGPTFYRLTSFGAVVANPHFLAHYLIPGNEMIAYFDGTMTSGYGGSNTDLSAASTLASNGYVAAYLNYPLYELSLASNPSAYEAVDSWNSAVPSSLRTAWYPTITSHPSAPSSLAVGGSFSLSVSATSPRSNTLTYQWERAIVGRDCDRTVLYENVPADSDHSGTTSATLSVSNTAIKDVGVYRCIVRDGHGPAYTRWVAVSFPDSRMCQRLDYNGDGVVNPDDLGDYITDYENTPPSTDFDCTGVVNPDDIGDFISYYYNPSIDCTP